MTPILCIAPWSYHIPRATIHKRLFGFDVTMILYIVPWTYHIPRATIHKRLFSFDVTLIACIIPWSYDLFPPFTERRLDAALIACVVLLPCRPLKSWHRLWAGFSDVSSCPSVFFSKFYCDTDCPLFFKSCWIVAQIVCMILCMCLRVHRSFFRQNYVVTLTVIQALTFCHVKSVVSLFPVLFTARSRMSWLKLCMVRSLSSHHV